ncbi:hypothetical protein ACQ4PT_039784 [Festuca glaucescens]
MTGKNPATTRSGAPPPIPPTRQPRVPRRDVDPQRVVGRTDVPPFFGTNDAHIGRGGEAANQMPQSQPPTRFEFGDSSNQGGRGHAGGQRNERFDSRFQNQGFNPDFGNFDEGYFEGNSGFGNGYRAADVDPFYLSEVWVRVSGCCYKERCDYLSLFGVGSLIEKTKEVDMEFTRSHSAGYGLLFKVERPIVNTSADVSMKNVDPDDKENEEDRDQEKQKQEDNSKSVESKNLGSQTSQLNVNDGSEVPHKQAVSLTFLKVGSHMIPLSHGVRSEGRTSNIQPLKLWGDRDDEEENLPSPMSPLNTSYEEAVELQNISN